LHGLTRNFSQGYKCRRSNLGKRKLLGGDSAEGNKVQPQSKATVRESAKQAMRLERQGQTVRCGSTKSRALNQLSQASRRLCNECNYPK
jgi:hypothetical protein